MTLPDRAAPVSLVELVTALGGEMGRLAELADRSQAALGVVLAAAHRPEGSVGRDLQRMDDLSQILHNLHDFVEALAEILPSTWRVDMSPALDRIVLGALASRLRRASGNVEISGSQHAEGYIEFFV